MGRHHPYRGRRWGWLWSPWTIVGFAVGAALFVGVSYLLARDDPQPQVPVPAIGPVTTPQVATVTVTVTAEPSGTPRPRPRSTASATSRSAPG